jgi:hypothetical protein
MSRVIKTIEIEGKPLIALFDTGAFHSYVLRKHLKGIPSRTVKRPFEVTLGGDTFVVRELTVVNGKIEGLDFATTVVPITGMGEADGHKLDAIIGAGTMEEWEITINPKKRTLGLDGLKRREFIEYYRVLMNHASCNKVLSVTPAQAGCCLSPT